MIYIIVIHIMYGKLYIYIPTFDPICKDSTQWNSRYSKFFREESSLVERDDIKLLSYLVIFVWDRFWRAKIKGDNMFVGQVLDGCWFPSHIFPSKNQCLLFGCLFRRIHDYPGDGAFASDLSPLFGVGFQGIAEVRCVRKFGVWHVIFLGSQGFFGCFIFFWEEGLQVDCLCTQKL